MLDPTLLAELAQFPSPDVADAIEEFDVRPRDEGVTAGSNGGLVHLTPDAGAMVGYAVTAKVTSHGDRLDPSTAPLSPWKHILDRPAPRIVIVEDIDEVPGFATFWGGVSASVHYALGCRGVVTNGAVRDLPEVRASGLNVLAGGVAVSHAYIRVVEVDVPVTVAGMRVEPGDLVHADGHGAVTVPVALAPKIPDVIRSIHARDERIMAYCKSPDFTLPGLMALMASTRATPDERG